MFYSVGGVNLVKTYNERTKPTQIKVFFSVDKNGNTKNIQVGNQVVSTEQGFQFYVDDYVAEQIHKCELYLDGLVPKLRVKEDEILFIPEENEEYHRRKQIEELEKRLKELKGDEDNEV